MPTRVVPSGVIVTSWAVVTVTCEVQVVTDPEVLRRVRRPDLGFNPIELGD